MNKSVNLRDSLEIVTSDNLLRDLVEKIAPALAYDWDATAQDPRKRSDALFVKMQGFQLKHPTQHCNLTTQLSTIALINAAQSGGKSVGTGPGVRFAARPTGRGIASTRSTGVWWTRRQSAVHGSASGRRTKPPAWTGRPSRPSSGARAAWKGS